MILGGRDENLKSLRQTFRKGRLEFWGMSQSSYPQAEIFLFGEASVLLLESFN